MMFSSMNVIVLRRAVFSLFFFNKEPKEEEMTEEEKAAQKARPIATNPIPGTPWYAHHIPLHLSSSTLWQLIWCIIQRGLNQAQVDLVVDT